MTRSFTEINATIARHVAESIGEDRFEMWFAGDDVFRIAEGQLVVQAADDLSLSFIRQQFGPAIQQALSAIAGPACSIRYTLSGHHAGAVKQACLFTDEEFATAGREAEPRPAGKPNRRSRTVRPARGATATAPAETESKTKTETETKTPRQPTLAQFQFGADNKLLETAVEQMLACPGKFNPLVVHGPVGCGKTHLLQAITAEARRRPGYRRCACLTSEQFTSGFIEGLQGKGLPLFRNKYRQLDLLAIDDVQFLAGKKATLVEFQNTVESLMRTGKQIVISSDRPIFELEFLGESLMTRLSSGMNCPIAWPDHGARLAIAENHARQTGVTLRAETIQVICQHLGRDVRMLLGAINRIHAASLACGESLDTEAACELLADMFQSQSPIISLERIERAVCDVCGVQPEELRSPKRIKRISTARMLAIWLSRRHTSAGLAEIGAYYGGRNHSTVVAARKKIEAMHQSEEVIDIKSQRIKVSVALERLENRLRTG